MGRVRIGEHEFWVLVYSAVLAWGDAVFPAELAVEVGEVLMAGSVADCGDAFVGVLQQLTGVREPQFADGVAEALAG